MRKNLLALLLVFSSGLAFSQVSVKGKVTSSKDGTSIPGVNITVKGTTFGTSTDINGNYTLNVPKKSDVLVASFIGFVTVEATVNNQTSINFTLEEDSKLLEEVLIVGYGTVDKSNHVGSSAQLDARAIENRPSSNVLTNLAGVAPGVQTTSANGAPGSSPGIRIRGAGSLSASNDALYVVDGVPYDGAISNLNPDDIESVTVLKDASTTAIFGSRGANGVIMITTKKGKSERGNLNLKVSRGSITRGLPEYETVDANTYYPLMWEVYRNSLQYGSLQIPRDVANGIASGTTTSYEGKNYAGVADLLSYNPFNVANNQIVGIDGALNPNASLLYADDLDWASAIQRGGQSRQNYNLSYDGATEKTNYFASFGYTNDQGYLLKSDYKRFTGRVNVSTQATKWLKTGINVNGAYAISNEDNTDGTSSFVNPFMISRNIGPIYPVYKHEPGTGAYVLDDNGDKIYDLGDSRPYASGRHTIWENELNNRNRVRSTLGSRLFASVTILPDLIATTNLSFDIQDSHFRRFDNSIVGDGSPAGRAYHDFYRTTSRTFNQLLEYKKSVGQHNFNGLVGHENYALIYNELTSGRSGIIVDGVTELPNFATILTLSSSEDNHTIESYFGRVGYDYKSKYILNATLRRDGNSRFFKDVRWSNFYSFGAAYNIEKEDFFNVSWVDFLKLRASYGVVGNDGDLGYYPYQALYTLGRNNDAEPGFTQSSIANTALTWESAKNFDIGLDFNLFKGKIGGSIEYFKRITDGLIFSVPLAISNGGTTAGGFEVDQNIGSLYNKGIEVQITGDVIKTKDFTYTATINATTYKNQITKMPPTQSLIQNGTKGLSVGHSIYDFYLRDFYGVDPETGNSLYRTNVETANTKISGSDTLTTLIGEANYRYSGHTAIPDVYGSMNNIFTYKSVSLSVLFTYSLGGKVYDSAYLGLMHGGQYGTALHVDALNRWQNPGDITDVPRFDNGQIANLTGGSSRYLIDASYLQLNNITLAYAIPTMWASKINSQKVSVYATAENLALFSKRQGLNVTGSFNGTVENSYSFNKVFSVGANITL